jgi:hypothetical protein
MANMKETKAMHATRHRTGETAPIADGELSIGDPDIWGNGINNTLVQPSIGVSGVKLNAAHRLLAAAEPLPEWVSHTIQQWISGGSGRFTSAQMQDALKAFHVVRESYRSTLPKVVYRGLLIPETALTKILNGKPLKVEPAVLSSWTSDPKVALKYANVTWDTPLEQIGIILAIHTPPSALFYIDKKFIRTVLDDPFSHDQKEVVVQGPGVSHVSRDNILAVVSETNTPLKVSEYLKGIEK